MAAEVALKETAGVFFGITALLIPVSYCISCDLQYPSIQPWLHLHCGLRGINDRWGFMTRVQNQV